MTIDLDLSFLETLLGAFGPTGFEDEAARVFVRQAESFADRVERDSRGNVYAWINPGAGNPLLLAGHLDEIGIIVNHVDENGFIYFQGLGGWDPQVLVGQRLRFRGESEVIGVVGRKPIHLLQAEERTKAVKMEELWADIGAAGKAEAAELIEVGTPAVIDQPVRYLQGRRMVSKAIDNRIGAFTVLEALRMAKLSGVRQEVVAVGTVQEEIGAFGARAAAFRVEPAASITVDVTHCTKQPGVDVRKEGESPLGSGANLAVGPFVHPKILARLVELAKEQQIPFTRAAHSRHTGTDADQIAISRAGVPAAVASIPNRYMHSPSELIDLADVEAVVRLLAHYAERPVEDFSR